LEAGAKKGQLLYPEGGSSEGAGTGKGGKLSAPGDVYLYHCYCVRID